MSEEPWREAACAMDNGEPIISDEDRRKFRLLKQLGLMHARTQAFRKRLDHTHELLDRFFAKYPDAYSSWSGGKDSTVLVHLLATRGHTRAYKRTKDSEYPNTDQYCKQYAERWGIDLDLREYGRSVIDYIRQHPELDPAAALNMTNSTLHHEYSAEHGHPGTITGMRMDESRSRRIVSLQKGAWYEKQDGQVMCNPLLYWSGKDVFAYLFSRDIEPFHTYRCQRLSDEPWRVRVGCWLPRFHSNRGGMVFLRMHYPSLYEQLRELLPSASEWT